MTDGLIRDDDYVVDGGCWVWSKKTGYDGYGRCRRRQRNYMAHRLYWSHYRGEIPDGMMIDHLCGNRACVNPDHLEVVSRTENARRSARCKLTADQVREIRALIGVIGYRRIAARYGITSTAVGNIAKGSSWTDIT